MLTMQPNWHEKYIIRMICKDNNNMLVNTKIPQMNDCFGVINGYKPCQEMAPAFAIKTDYQ